MRGRAAAGGCLIATLALGGCAPTMQTAALEPRPRSAGDLQLEVTEISLPLPAVAGSDPTLSAGTRVAVHVVARNTGAEPARFHPAALRVVVVGHQGATVTAIPIATVDHPGRTHAATRTPDLAPVVLQSGEARAAWIVFDGFGGLPTATTVEMVLRSPDLKGDLVLSSPVAPAPEWKSDSGARRFTFGFGTSWRTADDFGDTGLFDEELSYSWGRFFAGASLALGWIRDETTDPLTHYHAMALGVRLGWLPYRFPVGIVAGADQRTAFRVTTRADLEDEGSRPTRSLPSLSVAARFNLIPRGPGRTAPFRIVRDGVSPIGLLTVDIGYIRWLGREPFRANGMLFRLGWNVPN